MGQSALRSTAGPAVHIQDFTMAFGNRVVIDGLSFDIQRGETFGFLGSNGSGKTTTIRALLGIYQPTAGTLQIDGRVFRPENGKPLGYLPEERGLYKKESVLDVMVYFGRLKGLSHEAARKWSLSYLEKVDLADQATFRLDKLSGGATAEGSIGRHDHERSGVTDPGRTDRRL
ncbi:MAG TPA: ATP-binding cassette domain-containing protein [Acidimicrobiales bacterium]|nr:ATP-binding cassette domain-containing protein [Acidimicrobiales bacterium]